MPRFVIAVLLLSVAFAACQPTTDPDPTSTLTATSTTGVDVSTVADRIAVATVDGAIVVHDELGTEIARVDPPDGSFLRQPTWLDSSTVVFSEVSSSGDHSLSALDATTGAIVWRSPMDSPPFYFSPAPSGGLAATTSLRNHPSGVGLIAELIDATGTASPLSLESPFYTSWSPEGDALAIHIAGQRLDIKRADTVETILSSTGLFQTPVWVDRGLVTLRTLGGVQRLSLWSGGEFSDVAAVEGPVGFVAVGDLIAVQAVERPDAGSVAASLRAQTLPIIPGGNLIVIDSDSGLFETVSSELALLYQWNRSGDRLLYATLGEEPLSLVWNLWTEGTDTELATFTLQPPWFRNLVPFFDQYAQSVQLWSASGDHIGYPAIVDAAPVVVIQGIGGGDAVLIEGATWAAWSPGD